MFVKLKSLRKMANKNKTNQTPNHRCSQTDMME